MSIESFSAGMIFRGVIDPETAKRHARFVQLLLVARQEWFFVPAINNVMPSGSVLKAWLDDKEDEERQTIGGACTAEDADTRITDAFASFMNLGDNLDEVVSKESTGRFLQSYDRKGQLAIHDDKAVPNCIANLSGIKEFRIHDPNQNMAIIDRVQTGPGDMLTFNGFGWHSAVNISPAQRCETIGLVYSPSFT